MILLEEDLEDAEKSIQLMHLLHDKDWRQSSTIMLKQDTEHRRLQHTSIILNPRSFALGPDGYDLAACMYLTLA